MSTDESNFDGPTRIEPEELPLEPEAFADRMIEEVDAYIEHYGLDSARFDADLSEDEMREGLYTRIFNEIKAIDHPREMLDTAEDPQVFIHLLKQIEDEAKHARMLAQRLWNLGGEPEKVFERAADSTVEFWELFDDREDIVDKAAVLQSGAEHMAQYRHPKELEFYDDETAAIYADVIVPEEQFHAKIGKNVFRTHCRDEGSQRRALQSARVGRDQIRTFHDRGVTDAYNAGEDVADAD